ncbi:MAG: DNA repair protein RadC [Chloroflexi bacterium]|nr:DNA repair protein RadC [Chloroflexota bacterium]
MPLEDRPRERLAKLGVDALTSWELLAVLLGRGIKGESVVATASNLVARYPTFRALADAPLEELCDLRGVGPAKAAQIKAALEIGKRLQYSSDLESKTPIRSPEDAVALVKKQLVGKNQEQFMSIYLDSRNRPINKDTVTIGILDSSQVHPREAFRGAIRASAASVVFLHNHPSGDTQPSQDDIEITRRLVDAGKLLRIEVLDHIIVTDDDFLSMKARKLL